MTKNILVSGASGIVGYGILRSLRRSMDEYRLIGTTIYDFSVAPAFCDECLVAPGTDEPIYMDWLLETIRRYSVEMVIPGIECDMFLWNKQRDRIVSAGALPLLNCSELIELCRDKWLFYERLITENAKYAIPTALTDRGAVFPVPFILKPRCGYGSRGIVMVRSEAEFSAYRERVGSELMIQPVIGSAEDEYTVSAFFDSESRLIDYLPLKRKLSRDGYTQEAQVVNNDFSAFLQDMAGIFRPAGPTNFQFRLAEGSIKLLEINPRISAATSIRASFGYNESVMSVDYYLNGRFPEKVDKSGIVGKRAIRYIEDHVFL